MNEKGEIYMAPNHLIPEVDARRLQSYQDELRAEIEGQLTADTLQRFDEAEQRLEDRLVGREQIAKQFDVPAHLVQP